MSNVSQAQIMMNPAYIEPGIIVPISQVSGAFECLADGQPLPRLSEGDLAVYAKRIDMRVRVAAGNTIRNQLPSVNIMLSMVGTPTYEVQVRAEYDHHDTAAAARWGVSIAEANRLGMRQGHFQMARAALLYGFSPSTGEGLLNAVGATATTLPADSNGNTTAGTYDNGQLGMFFLQLINSLKSRTFQLGRGRRIVVLGPQRILGPMSYQAIVQLTQFQRPGGGTSTTRDLIESSAAGNGDTVQWVYDDTLQGKGVGGTDAVLMVMPEVEQPAQRGLINTNTFAEIAPNMMANTLMYCDMPAPREIPTPIPGGAIDIVSEWRISSGWPLRPEAITILSIAP